MAARRPWCYAHRLSSLAPSAACCSGRAALPYRFPALRVAVWSRSFTRSAGPRWRPLSHRSASISRLSIRSRRLLRPSGKLPRRPTSQRWHSIRLFSAKASPCIRRRPQTTCRSGTCRWLADRTLCRSHAATTVRSSPPCRPVFPDSLLNVYLQRWEPRWTSPSARAGTTRARALRPPPPLPVASGLPP